MSESKTITVQEGVMWEDNPFKIEIECECSEYGGKPCRHCHSHSNKPGEANKNAVEKVWICPAVVITTNEGGQNSTGTCLMCIIEAAKESNLL